MGKKAPEKPYAGNRFGLSEWSGAIGDLGTLLPLTFVLVIYNQFPVSRLFFLWGLVYVATGIYYRIPISVQPLKAMTIIAVTTGLAPEFLSSAAFFYGILFLFLAGTGLIRWLQQWFSRALVRGIQLGIGLMLAKKAFVLVLGKNMFLGTDFTEGWLTVAGTVLALVILYLGLSLFKRPLAVLVILVGLLIGWFTGVKPGIGTSDSVLFVFTQPQWKFIFDATILLIIPQLPLTLGNSIFAANDACAEFWPERSQNVNVTNLAGSIGVSNVIIGFLGGFPICHGAGGIAAHARFGAKTGGATIILGISLIILGLVDDWSILLFLIPVPILGALLLFDSWALIHLIGRLSVVREWIVAVIVGLMAFFLQNLTLAVLAGSVIEKILQLQIIRKRTDRLLLFLRRF